MYKRNASPERKYSSNPRTLGGDYYHQGESSRAEVIDLVYHKISNGQYRQEHLNDFCKSISRISHGAAAGKIAEGTVKESLEISRRCTDALKDSQSGMRRLEDKVESLELMVKELARTNARLEETMRVITGATEQLVSQTNTIGALVTLSARVTTPIYSSPFAAIQLERPPAPRPGSLLPNQNYSAIKKSQ
jgi:hypothetical protein